MIDALHFVYKNKTASEFAISNFKKHNPDSTYVVISDGGENFSDICAKYNCTYIHSPITIGYPQSNYGFRYDKINEYLSRFISAVSLCKSSHIMIMEDDVYNIDKMIISDDDEMLVTKNCLNNKIHPIVLNMIKSVSGFDDIDDYYGMGGGSIFKRQTFLESYFKHYFYYMDNFNKIQTIYPTIGWTDCIISIFMSSAGKKHKVNTSLVELGWPPWGIDHKCTSYDHIEEIFKNKASILHHYKKYY